MVQAKIMRCIKNTRFIQKIYRKVFIRNEKPKFRQQQIHQYSHHQHQNYPHHGKNPNQSYYQYSHHQHHQDYSHHKNNANQCYYSDILIVYTNKRPIATNQYQTHQPRQKLLFRLTTATVAAERDWENSFREKTVMIQEDPKNHLTNCLHCINKWEAKTSTFGNMLSLRPMGVNDVKITSLILIKSFSFLS